MAATRILITAGPTHEPIDAVRYLGNRSSGRLGLALAATAVQRGWETHLLLGPVTLKPPDGVRCDRFQTTTELETLLAEHFAACDLLIMAAAVADYRPVARTSAKLERKAGKLLLELESTPDLVAACAARRRAKQRIVAFALEAPEQLQARAAAKLKRKGVDAIVANPLVTMDAESITARVLTAEGDTFAPPDNTAKAEFAEWLLNWAAQQWQL